MYPGVGTVAWQAGTCATYNKNLCQISEHFCNKGIRGILLQWSCKMLLIMSANGIFWGHSLQTNRRNNSNMLTGVKRNKDKRHITHICNKIYHFQLREKLSEHCIRFNEYCCGREVPQVYYLARITFNDSQKKLLHHSFIVLTRPLCNYCIEDKF